METTAPSITLRDGTSIPQFGLGVWQMTDAEAEAAVVAAHNAGYTLIDTAAGYQNEAAVGRAIAQFDRDDFYITTKLKNEDHGYHDALRAFDASMSKLAIDTLDLYLIHWPSPAQDKYSEAWRALVDLQKDGRVRSIGVSNFEPHHLARIIDDTGVVPVLNQIELHPLMTQTANRVVHAEYGIATQAWSPLGSGRADVLELPALIEIARNHDATVAQTILAWHLAVGNVVIPKSVTPARIEENIGALELALSPDELAAIDGLDNGTRFGPHPDSF
jgi:2,5-diketo-D-gluconate reductase A